MGTFNPAVQQTVNNYIDNFITGSVELVSGSVINILGDVASATGSFDITNGTNTIQGGIIDVTATTVDIVSDAPIISGSITTLNIYGPTAVLECVIPSGSGDWSGITSNVVAGESVVAGDLLYIGAAGKWLKASNSSTGTMPSLGLSLSTGSLNDTIPILKYGYYNSSAYSWIPGNVLYCGPTGNLLTGTLTGSGTQVQAIGYAENATTIWIHPSLILVEIS